ncbi:Pimeloyl-ACP methyl ester carboxylesterase [Tenacibaculum sp. 190524A02b]|uniref:Pimeloyl-ACP methyl ester carboxylesterase n=1 Tax=Tenacibaculum vairaonense TaxID=3137860 RepID=A0ABP1F8L6_9FLAO
MIVSYKGASVFYTVQGTGNTIVLLHGFLENTSMWKDIASELSKTKRVVCIDLLGHGQTDCLGYVHTMEEMADAVKEVLKQLKVRRCFLIGHSMGGYVALAFTEKYFKNVKGICLLNSTAQEDTNERKEIREKANKMVPKNFHKMVQMSIPNLFTQLSKEKYAAEINEVLKQALKTSIRGYIASNEGMRLRENKELALKLISKRMIIVGKKDPVLNFESIKKEAERTETELIILPNGHMSHIEDKEELLRVLVGFINRKP